MELRDELRQQEHRLQHEIIERFVGMQIAAILYPNCYEEE